MWRLLLVAFLAALSLAWLFLLVSLAPPLETSWANEGQQIQSASSSSSSTPPPTLNFPSSLAELRSTSALLTAYYRHQAPAYVMLLFISAYLFKQTFAVPGSVFLNVLAGAVFGLPLAFVLCSFLTACGASCCFVLARICGRNAAQKYFPQRIQSFRESLEENRARLPYFLLFLRLFPMSPNWAINMCSGVLGVPLGLFFVTVLVGLMPYNYICVQTGVLLSSLDSMQDIFTWTTLAQMTAVALVALAPGYLRRAQKNA